jgi:hypothetical protein
MGMRKKPSNRSKTGRFAIAAVDISDKAVQLRREGRSCAEIGKQLGCSQSTAWEAINRWLVAKRADIKEAADDVREMELARMDEMMAGIYPTALQGDMQAIDRVLRIMERRAKLLGIDAPTRQEVTGAEGGPLDIRAVASEFKAKLMALSDAELEAEAKRLGVAG